MLLSDLQLPRPERRPFLTPLKCLGGHSHIFLGPRHFRPTVNLRTSGTPDLLQALQPVCLYDQSLHPLSVSLQLSLPHREPPFQMCYPCHQPVIVRLSRIPDRHSIGIGGISSPHPLSIHGDIAQPLVCFLTDNRMERIPCSLQNENLFFYLGHTGRSRLRLQDGVLGTLTKPTTLQLAGLLRCRFQTLQIKTVPRQFLLQDTCLRVQVLQHSLHPAYLTVYGLRVGGQPRRCLGLPLLRLHVRGHRTLFLLYTIQRLPLLLRQPQPGSIHFLVLLQYPPHL